MSNVHAMGKLLSANAAARPDASMDRPSLPESSAALPLL